MIAGSIWKAKNLENIIVIFPNCEQLNNWVWVQLNNKHKCYAKHGCNSLPFLVEELNKYTYLGHIDDLDLEGYFQEKCNKND